MEQRGNAQGHQIPPHAPAYQGNQMPTRPLIPAPHHYQQHLPNPPLQQTELDHQLRQFWADQLHEAASVTDFKTHSLPLARIKKIMKAEEEVKMVASEAPVLLAKACEMFIRELTLRSWHHTAEHKRRTLQKNDIITAVAKTDLFDFLVDTIPRDDFKGEEAASKPGEGGGEDSIQYPREGASNYYVPAPPLPPQFVGNYPVNQMVNVQEGAQAYMALPVNQMVDVQEAAQAYMAPPVNQMVNVQQAAQAYMAPLMWPQQPSPPPPHAGDSHDQG